MKKVWIIVAVVIIIAIAGYVGRHKIKAMFGATPAQPAMQAQPTKATSPAAMAPSDNIYLTKTDPTKGKYLTDFQSMTLYTFDKDTSGKSSCTDACAKIWPPYSSGATAQSNLPANITVIVRADGSKQFAWKGKPLYYYSKDAKAGDLTGDGFGGIWHIVTP